MTLIVRRRSPAKHNLARTHPDGAPAETSTIDSRPSSTMPWIALCDIRGVAACWATWRAREATKPGQNQIARWEEIYCPSVPASCVLFFFFLTVRGLYNTSSE